MFRFIQGCLNLVFHSGKEIPHRWRNLHQMGFSKQRIGILCLSGLSANGAIGLRRISRKLHRTYGRAIDVWQRNLFGHTGVYQHFRESRAWDWLTDAACALARMFARHENKEVILVGFSTGALVLVVLADFVAQLRSGERLRAAFARVCSFSGIFSRSPKLARIGHAAETPGTIRGLALVVPAFRLASRVDATLLAMCLVMYYVLIPAATLASACATPIFTPIVAASFVLNLTVFSRIWVPTGDSLADARATGFHSVRFRMALAVGSCFYCGLAPTVLAIADLAGVIFELGSPTMRAVAHFVFLFTLFIPLVWDPFRKREGVEVDGEPQMSPFYTSIPVISTATLRLIQWFARSAVRRLNVPVLFVIAEQEAVVDNTMTLALASQMDPNLTRVVSVPGLTHSTWSEQDQNEVTNRLVSWFHEELGLVGIRDELEEAA